MANRIRLQEKWLVWINSLSSMPNDTSSIELINFEFFSDIAVNKYVYMYLFYNNISTVVHTHLLQRL